MKIFGIKQVKRPFRYKSGKKTEMDWSHVRKRPDKASSEIEFLR